MPYNRIYHAHFKKINAHYIFDFNVNIPGGQEREIEILSTANLTAKTLSAMIYFEEESAVAKRKRLLEESGGGSGASGSGRGLMGDVIMEGDEDVDGNFEETIGGIGVSNRKSYKYKNNRKNNREQQPGSGTRPFLVDIFRIVLKSMRHMEENEFPLLRCFCSPCLQLKHWNLISDHIGFPDFQNTNFTLQRITELNLFESTEDRDRLRKITEFAAIEHFAIQKIRKMVKRMNIARYQDRQRTVLRNVLRERRRVERDFRETRRLELEQQYLRKLEFQLQEENVPPSQQQISFELPVLDNNNHNKESKNTSNSNLNSNINPNIKQSQTQSRSTITRLKHGGMGGMGSVYGGAGRPNNIPALLLSPHQYQMHQIQKAHQLRLRTRMTELQILRNYVCRMIESYLPKLEYYYLDKNTSFS